MNTALEQLAVQLGLHAPANEPLRLRFGHACSVRVRHLLERPEVEQCLDELGAAVACAGTIHNLDELRANAARLANQHQGSKSIDGCGHAAVSATYAVANAVAGKVLEAASYAAYAAVYASGGYAAVGEREAFEPEFNWQVQTLRDLAQPCHAFAQHAAVAARALKMHHHQPGGLPCQAPGITAFAAAAQTM